MSNEAGDRYLGHGDQDTRLNDTEDTTFEAGSWVVPTGDEAVELADANGAGDALVGVVQDPLDPGEKDTVHFRGIVWARVEDDVSAGDELDAPEVGADTGGFDGDEDTAGVATTGGDGGTGIYALSDAQDGIAKVLIR